MNTEVKSTPNPWLTGWTQPALTVRNVLATNPNRGLWAILLTSSVSYFFSALYIYSGRIESLSFASLVFLFVCIIASSTIGFYFVAWILKVSGKMLGGSANFKTMKAVVIWSALPNILSVFIYSLRILVTPESALLLNSNHQTAITWNLIGSTLIFWQLYLLGSMIREVQGFSTFRTIGNILLSYLLIFSFFLIIAISAVSVYLLFFNQK